MGLVKIDCLDYIMVVADLRSYLAQREKDLEVEIERVRAQIAPLERELFEVKVARAAVERKSREPLQPQLFGERVGTARQQSEADEVWRQYKEIEAARAGSAYGRLTIKELISKALSEQFSSGATAGQLLTLFATAWGRDDIVRTSLSPQLSRLKREGKIDRNENIWFLRSQRLEQEEVAATDQ